MKQSICLLALLIASAALAESGVAVRDTHLFERPDRSSERLTGLKAESALEIGPRQGGWYEARIDDQHGWVPMLDVRFDKAEDQKADSGLRSLGNVIHGGRSGSTVGSGVRGLDQEDLRKAKPDTQAVERMSGFAVTAQKAKQFAKEAGLKSTDIAYAESTQDSGGDTPPDNPFSY